MYNRLLKVSHFEAGNSIGYPAYIINVIAVMIRHNLPFGCFYPLTALLLTDVSDLV